MHLQNFKVQEHTIKEFTNMCERLEPTLSDLPSTEQTNKGSSNKNKSRMNKKRRCNNSNKNKGKIKSTVSCMARIPPTTLTIVKLLSSKLRSTKRGAVATAMTSATTRKRATIQTRKRSTRSYNFQRTQ